MNDPGAARARRVLVLADSVGGGTGSIIGAVTGRWDPARWQVMIMTPGVLRARLAPHVPVEQLPPLSGPAWYPVGQLRRFAQVRRRVRAHRPDVLHTYFFWSIIYGRLLRRAGVVRRLVENREDEGFNWGRHEYALLRATASVPDRIICVSDAVRRVVTGREGTPADRIVTIHNGIDMSGGVGRDEAARSRIRAEWGVGESEPLVGMVANFNRPVKGVPWFVEAMPLILARVPAARFVLVGRGEEEVSLRARMEELGVSERVTFAGFRNDIGPCYDAMDVSVLTSLSEGLSMTVLESMRHGLPVVVTAVGGNPEIVREGETGHLVPPRDVAAFASRVAELLADPARRAAMGAAARRVVAERFDIARAAERYLEVYEEGLGATGV